MYERLLISNNRFKRNYRHIARIKLCSRIYRLFIDDVFVVQLYYVVSSVIFKLAVTSGFVLVGVLPKQSRKIGFRILRLVRLPGCGFICVLSIIRHHSGCMLGLGMARMQSARDLYYSRARRIARYLR